jgi:PAS domain S-box-containing protein
MSLMNNEATDINSLKLELEQTREALHSLRQELDEVRSSEDRLRTIIDKIPTFAWAGLPDGSKEFFSQRWLDYTGLTADKALGWGWKAAIHPDDLSSVVTQLRVLETAEKAGVIEARLRRHDGAYRWFQFKMEPFLNDAGRLIKWYGISTDVDDQRKAEAKLLQSERNLAEGQRLTKTGSWVLDLKTGQTDWSVETCRIFGFPDPPPSPHYSEFLARVHPEHRDAVNRGLRESFETGEPRPLEYEFILPDGTTKQIKTVSEPVRNTSGAILLMGTIMDVTEQKAAEESLQASEIFARGQLNALTRTLEYLSAEPDSDKLLEHVLRTITEQLGAHSCGVWRRIEASGLMSFDCAFEAGRLVTDSKINVTAIDPALPLPGIGLQGSSSAIGQPTLLADIREGPLSAWREYLIAQGVVTILFLPTGIAGRVEGVLSIRFSQKRTFCFGEVELAQALAIQVMLAMQLRQNRQATLTAERNRLARDIHDTLAQGFTGVIMQLEAAKGAAAKGTLEGAQAHIDRANALARTSLEEARRSVRALRPRSLRDGNLCEALADLLKKMSDSTQLTATFRVEGEHRTIPEEWEDDLLRITQESLTNTIKHAHAKNFRAKLAFGVQKTELQIADDGQGFDPQDDHDGFGLIGMRERVERMGGEFSISSQLRWGTKIVIVLHHFEKTDPK